MTISAVILIALEKMSILKYSRQCESQVCRPDPHPFFVHLHIQHISLSIFIIFEAVRWHLRHLILIIYTICGQNIFHRASCFTIL